VPDIELVDERLQRCHRLFSGRGYGIRAAAYPQQHSRYHGAAICDAAHTGLVRGSYKSVPDCFSCFCNWLIRQN